MYRHHTVCQKTFTLLASSLTFYFKKPILILAFKIMKVFLFCVGLGGPFKQGLPLFTLQLTINFKVLAMKM